MDGSSKKNDEKLSPLEIYGDVRRISRIFFFFSIVILVSMVSAIFILFSNHDIIQIAIVVATIPLVLVGMHFTARRAFEPATIFLAVILFLLITIISTSGNGIHHLGNLGFPAILILSSLVTRKKTLVFLTGFAIVCVAWLVFGELLGLYTPKTWQHSVPGDFFSIAMILIATTVMVRLIVESLYESRRETQKELGERKRAEERLAYDALHDALTGLPNRSLLNDRLGQLFEHARRHPDSLFAILFIDLDRFKVVNDSLGHAVGDELLITAARRLQTCTREEDTVSRLSGDEFAILLPEVKEVNDAIRVAQRVLGQISSTSIISKVSWVTTASIGIALYNAQYNVPQELMRDADSAMYRAKAKGGGQYEVFDETMYANALERLQIEADLKQAVENNALKVYYQPIINLADGKVAGFEALVRWDHPTRGIVLPGEFIHVAEETGLIIPIGEAVVREACRQLKAWRSAGQEDLWVSVNLSARQFRDPQLVDCIAGILAENDLPAGCLHIEITESVAMQDMAFSQVVLQSFAALGTPVSLDDFGTGYSSLGYIHHFPFKILKIDRSFIHEITNDLGSQAITGGIISMCRTLHLSVVAEGIENEAQLDALRSLSCDMIQGFLTGRPMPAEEVTRRWGDTVTR
jgi:diguanylate cyclase (GGDEF)-like protein